MGRSKPRAPASTPKTFDAKKTSVAQASQLNGEQTGCAKRRKRMLEKKSKAELQELVDFLKEFEHSAVQLNVEAQRKVGTKYPSSESVELQGDITCVSRTLIPPIFT
jgi:hypothetical protein